MNDAVAWLRRYKCMAEDPLISHIAHWGWNVNPRKAIQEALDQNLIIKEVRKSDGIVIYYLNDGTPDPGVPRQD